MVKINNMAVLGRNDEDNRNIKHKLERDNYVR